MTHKPPRPSRELGPDAPVEGRTRPPRHGPEEDALIRKFAVEAARLLRDLHCEQVMIFDVRGLSDLTDYIVLASGTSDRQIKSVSEDVEELARESGLRRFGYEVDGPTSWLVIDFVDVVVHLFEPATRAHYDLEMLWGDAPLVPWQR